MANADVKEMLATWLDENNSTQWSEGLRFLDKEHKTKSNCTFITTPFMFLSSAGPLSTDGIGMITLSPLERTKKDI
jgi:hypothetical protein